MKFVPGHMFKVTKPKLDFKVGETYKIYHIFPIEEGVEYVFNSSNGQLSQKFDSTEHAEKIIEKISR